MLKDLFKSLITKGSYTQDIAIIGIGKILIALIGFIFIPILARIYSPEAFGLFSIYNTTVSILVLLASLSYPSAFVIQKNENDFYRLLILSSSLLLIITSFLFLIVLFLNNYLIRVFEINSNSIIFYLIPLGVLINGIIVILSQTNIRRKNYVLSSSVDVTCHFIIRIINLVFGIITKGNPYGLILGNQIGNSLAHSYNFIINIKTELKGILENANSKNIIPILKKFRNYPYFILPGQLLNILKIQGSIYFIGAGFGQSILGAYSMSMNLLNIPIQIAGNSVSSVYLKTATEYYHNNAEKLSRFTYKTANSLFLISFIPFSILLVLGKEILVILLGEIWQDAGIFASILSPYFFYLIIFSPLTTLFQIYGREKTLLTFNLFTLIFNILSLSIGLYTRNPYITMILFSISNSIVYIILGWKIFKLLKINFFPFFIRITFLFLFSCLIIYGIKVGLNAVFNI